jgi:hypothetical protein
MKSSSGHTSLEIIREQPNPHNFQLRPRDHIIITTMMKLTARVVISFSLFMALTLQVATASGALTSSPIEQQHNLEESGGIEKPIHEHEIIQVETLTSKRQLRGRERPQNATSGSITDGTMPALNGTNANHSAVNGTYGSMSGINGTIGTMADVTPFKVSSTYPTTIISWMNGKCIDAGDKKSGNRLIMYSCSGWNSGTYYGNQMIQARWYYALTLANVANLCFDVKGGVNSMKAGAEVILYTCNGAVNQQWNYDSSTSQLKAGPPGSSYNYLCLDIKDANIQNGALLQLWYCTSNNWNQKWSTNNFGWFSYTWLGSGGFPKNGNIVYGPSGAEFGALFDGWTAIADNWYPQFDSNFKGTRFLTVGGGNENGKWTLANINGVKNNLWAVKNKGCLGIGIDIEWGDRGLANAFTDLFATAKKNGLQVFVTVSGNAPYNVPVGRQWGDQEACNLMKSILSQNWNIDFVVPQLYWGADGKFKGYQPNDCGWGSMWRDTAIPVVPAIYSRWHETSMRNWASSNNIKLSGYMLWTNYNTNP